MHISSASTLIRAIRTDTERTDSDAIPETSHQVWAVFIYWSFFSPPTSLVFLERKYIFAFAQMYTPHNHIRPHESHFPCDLFFCPRICIYMDSLVPRKARGISISGASPKWSFFIQLPISMVSVKIRSLSPSPLFSGWKGPADPKTAADREEKVEELHAHLHAQTQCEHTLFLQEIRLKSNRFFASYNNSEPFASTASTKEETSFRKYK